VRTPLRSPFTSEADGLRSGPTAPTTAVEQGKSLIYAAFATFCKPLQRLMHHSYLEQESDSSPLVGSPYAHR